MVASGGESSLRDSRRGGERERHGPLPLDECLLANQTRLGVSEHLSLLDGLSDLMPACFQQSSSSF